MKCIFRALIHRSIRDLTTERTDTRGRRDSERPRCCRKPPLPGGRPHTAKGRPVYRSLFRFIPGPPSQRPEILIRWLRGYLRPLGLPSQVTRWPNPTEVYSPAALEARGPSGSSEGKRVPGPCPRCWRLPAILGGPRPADASPQSWPPPLYDLLCVSFSVS